MGSPRWPLRAVRTNPGGVDGDASRRLLADGGEDEGSADGARGHDGGDGGADETESKGETESTREAESTGPTDATGETGEASLDRSNVEVTEAGGTDPADPKWEKPDMDDIPEFEIRADEPMAGQEGGAEASGRDRDLGSGQRRDDDPTSGMPNTARSPGDSRIKREGTEGYVAALELCARLPEDARLPEEAADLVPAAVEAELERDVQSFAAAEFDNQSPHVDVLDFVERDGEIWLRLRLGIPPGAFADLDPEEIRSHALQELEGLL